MTPRRRAALERRVAARNQRIDKIDEQIGRLMSQRVSEEEALGDLLRELAAPAAKEGGL